MKAVDATNWNDKSAVLHALTIGYERLQKSGISPIEKISDELLVERDVAMAALSKDWDLTLFLLNLIAKEDSHPQHSHAQSLLGDRAFMLTALQEKEKEEYRSYTTEQLFDADHSVAYYASAELQDDREFMLALIKKFGAEIEHASKRLQGDPELVLIGGWRRLS